MVSTPWLKLRKIGLSLIGRILTLRPSTRGTRMLSVRPREEAARIGVRGQLPIPLCLGPMMTMTDVMPFNYAHPYTVSDTSAGVGDSAAADRGKKRAAEEPAAEQKRKKVKKTTSRKASSAAYVPPKPKQRTVGTG